MNETTMTNAAKSKLLRRVATLTERANHCRHLESLGGGSPLSTLTTDLIRRENGREAWAERQAVAEELRRVCGDLLAAGCRVSTINSYSLMGPVVGMVGTGEWVERRPGDYQEDKRPAVTV